MFLEDPFKNGSQSENKPETYELLESGWIDKATEFLGVGRWAIGRPKSVPHAEPLKVKPARHIETVPQKQSSPQSQIVDIAPIRIETIFNQLLPNQFRIAQGLDDNAIDYRNVMVMGSQGSGKTTLARVLALHLEENTATRTRFSPYKSAG